MTKLITFQEVLTEAVVTRERNLLMLELDLIIKDGLKKDINIKEPIKARKIELFDRSKITNQAFCDYLDLHDSSHVDKLKNLMGHVNMSENINLM